MDDELRNNEILSQFEIAQRGPRFGELLRAAHAVAMEERDMRAIRGALRAEHGLAEPSQVAVRIVDDKE